MSSDVPGRKLKSESMSFRLDKRDLDGLREIAKKNKMSLNTLVSQIIDRYLKLWVFDHQFGFFSVAKKLLQMTFVKYSDKEIDEIGEEIGSKAQKEIIRHLYGKVNKKTVLDYIDIFGTRFEGFRHFTEGSRHTLAVTHDINLMFSKIYYAIIKSTLALAEIDTVESEGDISETGFSISFDL